MKKTYMNPTTNVLYVETVHMIAASETIGIGDDFDGLDEAILSRGEIDIFDIAK